MAFIAHQPSQKRRTHSCASELKARLVLPHHPSPEFMCVLVICASSHEEERRRSGELPPNVVEVEREGTLASGSVDDCRETMCREEATLP